MLTTNKPVSEKYTSLAANKAIVRRYFEGIWNGRPNEVMDELYADNITSHRLLSISQGPAEVKQVVVQNIDQIRAAVPDVSLYIETLSARGDLVCIHWRLDGTLQGELQGRAATGKPITISGVTDVYLDGGKIVELWPRVDVATFKVQYA